MAKNAAFLSLFKAAISAQVGAHAESVVVKLVQLGGRLIIDFKLSLFGVTQSMVMSITDEIKSSGFADGCLTAIEERVESSSFTFSSKGASLTPGSCAVLEPPDVLPKPPTVTGTMEFDLKSVVQADMLADPALNFHGPALDHC